MKRRELPLPSQKHIALAMAVISCPHLPGWKSDLMDRRRHLKHARRTLRNLAALGFEVRSVGAKKRSR